MPKIFKAGEKSAPNLVQPSPVLNDEAIEIRKEYGGPKGEDPTRYGDWEKKGKKSLKLVYLLYADDIFQPHQ